MEKTYSKYDKEYKDNGYYLVDGEEYQTIWRFRMDNGLPYNDKNLNAADSANYRQCFPMYIKCIPDGGVGWRYAFIVSELKKAYIESGLL